MPNEELFTKKNLEIFLRKQEPSYACAYIDHLLECERNQITSHEINPDHLRYFSESQLERTTIISFVERYFGIKKYEQMFCKPKCVEDEDDAMYITFSYNINSSKISSII